MLVPVPNTVEGLKPALTLLGSPDAVRFTLPAKPLGKVTVIVDRLKAPEIELRVEGVAPSVKVVAGLRLIVKET